MSEWTYKPNERQVFVGGDIIDKDTGEIVAHMAYAIPESRTNKILAAPDMAEALEECVEYFRSKIINQFMENETISYFEGYKKGIEALQKVKGEL